MSNEGREEYQIDLAACIAIVELLLIRRPMDAAHLHRLIGTQVGDNHLRCGLSGQIYRIYADQRALSGKGHILVVGRDAQVCDRSMLIGDQVHKLAATIEEVQ